MSREYAKKLNEILMIRAQNRMDDFHKPTGITKLLERNNTKDKRENFDKMFKDHIIDGIKTKNIRGLFRVPDINDTNHLVVDAVEDKEDKEENQENTMQIPENNNIAEIPQNRAMMSYPLSKPNVRYPEEIKSGETKRKVEKLPLIGSEGIEPVPGFDDPIYKYETQPRTIKDYIKLSKKNEHKVIAVMNPLTHEPEFVIKNKGDVTKLYHNKGLPKYYKYYDKDVQDKAAESMGIKGKVAHDLYSKWNHDKLDQIRLQEHPVKFNIRDLPDDIVVIGNNKNDDDDDDPEHGAGRIKDIGDFIIKSGDEYMKVDKEDDDEEDDDDDDNDRFYSPAKSQRFEVYNEEIVGLRKENHNIKRELEEILKSFPELTSEYEKSNKSLEDNLRALEEENNYYREIEETAKRDLESLKHEYNQKIAEVERKDLTNKNLYKQIDEIKEHYNNGINRINRLYESSKHEASSEIQELFNKHKSEVADFKSAYHKLEQGNRDLNYKYENERSKVRDLEDRLQQLNTERFQLERNLTSEIQRLKHELSEQRNNFTAIREQEINNLNQFINQLNSQKQQIENQYAQLYSEYQNMVKNMNALSADQSQYLNALQAKDKQQEEDRNVYNTNYNNIVAEKNSIEKDKLNIEKEATDLINQKDQIIQQLINEINQLKLNQSVVAKPEEINLQVQEQRVNPAEIYRDTSVSQGTRSHGPVEQGGFIETVVFDESGRVTNSNHKYKLQTGKEYNPKEFFTKLLQPDRGEIQQFKLAVRNTYNKRSFTKPEDYTKFVEEELNILFPNRLDLVVAAMKNIIDNSPGVATSFKKLYEVKSRELKK